MGGLLAGFCVGIIAFARKVEKRIYKMFWLLVGVTLTTVYFVATLTNMYSGNVELVEDLRDVCGYYQQFFNDYVCRCMRAQQQ